MRTFRRALVVAAAIVSLALPAEAGFDFASREAQGPVQVSADQGIEWNRGSKVFIARGNAEATRGNVTVTGDELHAYYRESQAGDTEIYRVEAYGVVTIATPTETATGNFASYDIDGAKLTLKGAPAKLVTPTDTVTATDSIEYSELTRLAVARGDALASRADRRVRADILTARFEEDANGRLVLQKADAVGHVVLTTATEVITGDKGDYNAKTGVATVTGAVKITREDNQLNGGYAHVNLNSGISRLFAAAPGARGNGKRVQGLFVPQDGQQPPAEGEGAGPERRR